MSVTLISICEGDSDRVTAPCMSKISSEATGKPDLSGGFANEGG